jgi:hypothetical protein
METREGEIIVTVGDFCAVYFKPPGQPQLVLRSRTGTDAMSCSSKSGRQRTTRHQSSSRPEVVLPTDS